MKQLMLRGWRRLAAPHTSVSKLLVQEFYANAAISDEEAAEQDKLPYKRFVRGKVVDFSPSNIRRVMRFKRKQLVHKRTIRPVKPWTKGLTRQTELHPLAKGWQEFIIHSLVPTGNKSEVTIARAILIHCIMRGEEVRAEDIIAENMAVIAQGLPNKGNLAFPSTIYKLCKDAGVPLREFRRTPRIPKLSYLTARRMEAIKFPRNLPQPKQDDNDEDEPMPQADGGNDEEEDQQQPQHDQQPPQHGFPDFQPHYESQFHETLQGIESHLSSMQFFQQTFYENMQKSQADYMEEVKQIKEKQEEIWTNNQRFQSRVRQEQERLAKEIQEVRKSQITQTLANNKRLETEKNMQLAMEKQGRDIVEMRKQLNLCTRNTSAREAYTCWVINKQIRI
ncbi:hypothetical protein PIB30_079179 [Stylosanthes scabra]|uniref:Putative plant transposon protein domain-containing protein n=1 Tax=Stylosanthes scabra TaxID=79078 RepID=A0ABU6XTK9_9FABA|nr:hypothetical protein [Stylosanthes scabra]